MRRHAFPFAATLIAPLILAACSGKHTPKPQPLPPPGPMDPAAGAIPKSEAYDPCVMQMQDICGAILLYYVVNHHLPPKLEDILPYQDELGTPLQFTCPADKKPYVYVPAGLRSGKLDKPLILYDAEPVHNGHRWGIVMAPPRPGKPLQIFPIPITNDVFKLYENGQ